VPHLKYHPDPEMARESLGHKQILEVVESLDEIETGAFLKACAEKNRVEGYRGDIRTFDKDEFIKNGYRL